MGILSRFRVLRHSKGRDPRAVDAETVTSAFILSQPTRAPLDAPALLALDAFNPTIFACVQRIAEDAASIPLQLVRKLPEGKTEVVEGNWLHKLLTETPNNFDTAILFWQQFYVDFLMSGNVYTWLDIRGSEILNLVRLAPVEIEPLPDPKLIVRGYRRLHNGHQDDYPPEVVWHVRSRNSLSPYQGAGVPERLRDQINLERSMLSWQKKRFDNDIPVELLFTTNQKIPPTARVAVEDYIDQKLNARRNGGRRWMMLEEGLWNATVLPRVHEKEIEFKESLRVLRETYRSTFGVPPNKLADFESPMPRANSEEQERFYWEDTIMALHSVARASLNRLRRRFVDGDDLSFEHDYSGVRALNSSSKDLAEIRAIKIGSAQMSPNEARAEDGLDADPDPAADLLYLNGRALAIAAEPPAIPPAFGPEGDKPKEEEQDPKPKPGEDPEEDPEKQDPKARRLRLVGRKAPRPEEFLSDGEEQARFRALVRRYIEKLVREAGEEQLDVAGLGIAFDLADPKVLEFVSRQIVSISEATVIGTNEAVRLAVAQSIADGASTVSIREEIQRAFKQQRERWHLDRISRTEVHSGQEGGAFHAAQQGGLEAKSWITSRDDRVRGLDPADASDHAALEDLGPVPIEAVFEDPRSGARLRFPGDREGAVSGADTINCRCTWVADFSAEAEGESAAAGGRGRRIKAPLTLDEVYYRKSSRRDRWESILNKLLGAYIRQMETRALRAFDAAVERNGGASSAVA